jgi:outer membrane protein assembly factor BamB
MKRVLYIVAALLIFAGSIALSAEDWPEFRGKGRKGEWTETGILEKFPADGLKILWRTPIKPGYSSPTVADGRVFLTDRTIVNGPKGTERAYALDEKTGKMLWSVEWEADYGGIMWPNGPRATPTVDGDRVYVLGATGVLHCLDVKTGKILWKRDYVAEYKAQVTAFGIASPPVVEGSRLIALVGGDKALAVAFDKMTGKELWRSQDSPSDPGMGHPIVITAGGVRQAIIWGPTVLYSLNPETGAVYWQQAYRAMAPMSIPVPVFTGKYLLATNFYTGSILMELDDKTPTAKMVWKGTSESEIVTDGLHSVIGTPVILGDYIYGTCSYGQLRCLRLGTGERLWESQAVTKERARWASAFIVRNGDRMFISNDRGELMIARFTPEGYQEIDRTTLIKPTSPPGVRRQLGTVSVVHPAYANRHIYMRNDEEVICASLAADDSKVSSR